MTYIIVSKSEASGKIFLKNLLQKFFQKEITSSPDIHTLDPLEKNSIGVEEVKEFQKKMKFQPFEEKYQVGIILQAEKLTPQSQNALLKTLEDSSESTIYILSVNNEKSLLATIRSRGQILYAHQESQKDTDSKLLPSNFLDMDPVEQFLLLEEYSKEKTSSLNFINELEDIFKARLELDIKNGNIDSSKVNLSHLRILQGSREKISSNCNRRLTLESTLIQLNT